MPELKSVLFQTMAPSTGNPEGACEVAYYSVDDRILTMRTAEGSKTGRTYRLKPGDDERRVAGRLGLCAWRNRADKSDFNRQIVYGRSRPNSMPSTTTSPSRNTSIAFTQRISVDLPEPDRG